MVNYAKGGETYNQIDEETICEIFPSVGYRLYIVPTRNFVDLSNGPCSFL